MCVVILKNGNQRPDITYIDNRGNGEVNVSHIYNCIHITFYECQEQGNLTKIRRALYLARAVTITALKATALHLYPAVKATVLHLATVLYLRRSLFTVTRVFTATKVFLVFLLVDALLSAGILSPLIVGLIGCFTYKIFLTLCKRANVIIGKSLVFSGRSLKKEGKRILSVSQSYPVTSGTITFSAAMIGLMALSLKFGVFDSQLSLFFPRLFVSK